MAKRADGLKFLVVGTNNLITFGSAGSKKFRAACGIAVGDATKQAHHIIPRGSQIIEHPAVQKAAQANINEGFHIDQALNGIPVANGTQTQHNFMFNHMIPVFTNVLADLKNKLITQTDINLAENQDPWLLSNNEFYPFSYPALYYYLSLKGLHESEPFLNQFPIGAINYEIYTFVMGSAIFSLTKTKF